MGDVTIGEANSAVHQLVSTLQVSKLDNTLVFTLSSYQESVTLKRKLFLLGYEEG